MADKQAPRTVRRSSVGTARLMIVALIMGALTLPVLQPGPAGAAGAAATVGDGLATTVPRARDGAPPRSTTGPQDDGTPLASPVIDQVSAAG